jgi:hypothetical protein
MIELLGAQLLAVAATLVIFCMPGVAISRLLELHLRVPAVAMPAVAFTFGLGVWTVLLLPGLWFGWEIRLTLLVHVLVTAALLAWSVRRERRRGHARRASHLATVEGWTVAVIVLASLAALVLRTRMAFDTLFHVGLVRRLAQLESPTFENLDRVVGAGVNPAYALPSWQAAMAAVSAVTGLDPATVVEAMAIVGVFLAACCAAALGRVVTRSGLGELAGVAAYAWLRVTFPRRELEGDGVAYAGLPGNLALDVMLPLALIAAVLLLQSRRGSRRDGALVALAAVATILLVVLHANYGVFLAIIGLGTVLWMLAAGPWNRDIAHRVALAVAALAIPGLVALAALLPLLMLLEHFGAPLEARIDYHLASLFGRDVVRPGHLYDWFAAPGLLGMLLLPWATWRARGVARALIGGGSLALLAFALVPPLVELLGASGSLTLSLRLPRPLGVLLVAAAAVVIPDLVQRVAVLAGRVRAVRGTWAARGVWVGALVPVVALSAVYGYPLARREPAEYGWNWPTLFAVAGLLVVLAFAIVERRRSPELSRRVAPPEPVLPDDGVLARKMGPGSDIPVPAVLPMGTLGLALVALAVAMLPSGAMSMRRAAWQARDVAAAYRADDLRCLDGVQSALRDIPAGDVLLADPVTAYSAQALAPVYIAADFKTWNGSTDSERIDRRMLLLRATFGRKVGEFAGAGLARLSQDLDAGWVLVAAGEVEPPIGSELSSFDAVGLRDVLASGDIGATLVASGPGRLPDDVEESERIACDLSLWKLDGSEASLELRRDGADHANDSTMRMLPGEAMG